MQMHHVMRKLGAGLVLLAGLATGAAGAASVVSIKGKTRFSKLRTFRLDEPQKGKLRIVLTKNKPVRIEGVAIVTDE